jgi:long-chain acyl-CoA synthetase
MVESREHDTTGFALRGFQNEGRTRFCEATVALILADPASEMEAIEARLVAPGAPPNEIVIEDVCGVRMPVFKSRRRSLRSVLEGSLDYADREYLVFGERRISYRDHFRAVAATAAALHERYGIGKGDRVAILAANCPEWIIAFWATACLGGIVVGMNGWWAPDEIRYALGDSEPKLLIVDRKRFDRVRTAPPAVPVVEIEDDFAPLTRPSERSSLPTVPLGEDDPAVILYTSGTTGRPKGAVSTHRNILGLLGLQSFHGARLAELAQARGISLPRTQHVRLNAAPLFHVSGLYSAAVAQLASGMKSVWMTGRFDPKTVLELIEKERINGWGPLGSMAIRVANHPDRDVYDLSSMQSIGCGGAPVTQAVQDKLREAFSNARSGLAVGYGLTECTGLATMIAGDELERHPDSVGMPLPTVAIEIRDEEGHALPEGREGEITIRSPLVMKEYWRNPEATATSIGPGRWLRTGDIGRIVDGRLHVSTRKRDMILRGAENVYPVEIENRLAAHPMVVEAAVVGVDHPELGQEVKAFVVLEPGKTASLEELARFVGETLAYYKVPSKWEARHVPLPRNASGKVMKWLLEPGVENPLKHDE